MKLWQSRYNPQCKLSQQGLLDISEEIAQSYAPHDTHHQAELVLMPVDPVNLYAYWNLKDSDTENIIEHVDKQLALRIYSLPELNNDPGHIKLSFDIKVAGFQNQQQVHLPLAAAAYSAVIGEITADHSFSPLVTADTIHVPRKNPVPEDTLNNPEHVTLSETTQEQSPVIERFPQKNRVAENNKNTTSVAPIQEDHFVGEEKSQNHWSEAITLKNYNDYGYDLKLYKHQSTSETNPVLSQSELAKLTVNTDTQADSNKPDTNKANSKNISGLGRQS